MPPRPFPLPLAVGTDICHISRIRALVTNASWTKSSEGGRRDGKPSDHTKLRRFLQTLMTFDEILHFAYRFPHALASEHRNWPVNVWAPTFAHLAGRFAAKEAISKAFGGTITRHQITILSEPQPLAVVHAEPRVMTPQQRLIWHERIGFEITNVGKQPSRVDFDHVPARLEDLEGQLVKLSISHDADYATAACIAPT